MARLLITAVVMDDRDLELLGDSLVEQTGAIAVADIDEDDLPALTESGLCVQTVTRTPPRLSEFQLAPPPYQRTTPIVITDPRAIRIIRPIGGRAGSYEIATGTSGSDVRVVSFDRPIVAGRLDAMVVNGWRPLERLGPLASTGLRPARSVSWLSCRAWSNSGSTT
jgi:hypothetical protein